jgi:hypothetical protein
MGFGGLGRSEQAASGLGAFTWCSKSQPCATGDPKVSALQKALNTALRAHGFQPLTVDGKLGAGTCGAVAWAGNLPDSDPLFTTPGVEYMAPGTLIDDSGAPVCQTFTYPTPVGSKKPYVPPSTFSQALPWMQVNPQTGTVQTQINNDLVNHGYDPIDVSGMLDAPTCGAMQTAKNEWGMDYLTAYGGGCQAFQPPHRHASAAPPPAKKTTAATTTSLPVKKSGVSTAWVIGGLAVAASVAGLFAARKR